MNPGDADLQDLYQEVILDHNKRPRNFGKPRGANAHSEGYNPLCGDAITIHVTLEDDRIRDIGFEGSGCAVSKASASMMTEALKGKTLDEAQKLFEVFHRLLTTGGNAGDTDLDALGKLAAFTGVREFPMRVKCATLAWHAFQAALAAPSPNPADRAVSTE